MSERKTVQQISNDLGFWVRLPSEMTWDWASTLEAQQINETEWLLDDLVGAWRMVRMEDELVIMATTPPATTAIKKMLADLLFTFAVVTVIAVVGWCLGKVIVAVVRWALGGG